MDLVRKEQRRRGAVRRAQRCDLGRRRGQLAAVPLEAAAARLHCEQLGARQRGQRRASAAAAAAAAAARLLPQAVLLEPRRGTELEATHRTTPPTRAAALRTVGGEVRLLARPAGQLLPIRKPVDEMLASRAGVEGDEPGLRAASHDGGAVDATAGRARHHDRSVRRQLVTPPGQLRQHRLGRALHAHPRALVAPVERPASAVDAGRRRVQASVHRGHRRLSRCVWGRAGGRAGLLARATVAQRFHRMITTTTW